MVISTIKLFLLTSPMELFINSPDIMSERAGVARIRMRDHFLWPFYREMAGWEEEVEGEQMIFEPSESPLRKGIDLVWPTGHVYEFVTNCNTKCVFYAQSGLVSLHGALYAIFYEQRHVLGSYAWLADQGHQVDTALSFRMMQRGICNILRIEGLHIHRSTGEIVRWIFDSGETIIMTGVSDCMRIRPRVPWHTRNFYTGGATARITLDLAVVRLQRWMRKKCKEVWSAREIELWNQFRDYGLFTSLTDDLFRLVIAQAVRTCSGW